MSIANKKFDQAFSFLEYIYRGNWQFRWENVPFINQNSNNTKGESVIAHSYSSLMLWFSLRYVLPHINKIIHSEKIYEHLLIHDIGEIEIGDISRATQIAHPSATKDQDELSVIEKLVSAYPPVLGQRITALFREFTFNDKQSLESLMANYCDSLQGNHFALIYGFNLQKNSQLISKIINSHFIPISTQLIDRLNTIDLKAGQEIQSLTSYHLQSIRNAGIKLVIN